MPDNKGIEPNANQKTALVWLNFEILQSFFSMQYNSFCCDMTIEYGLIDR